MSIIRYSEKRRRIAVIALWVARVLAVLGWLDAVVGTVLIVFVDVESVVGTGPILFIFGLLLVVSGAFCRNGYAVGVAISMIAVSLLFFGLVYFLRWSPRDAEQPFTVMSIIYVVLMSPLVLIALLQRPRVTRWRPWECQSCGYPLFGLKTPSCPECGTPFDRARIPEPPTALMIPPT